MKRVFSSVFAVPGSLTGCYGGFALCDYYPLTVAYASDCADIGSYLGYYLGSYLEDKAGGCPVPVQCFERYIYIYLEQILTCLMLTQ